MSVLKVPKQRLEEIILEEIQKFKLTEELAPHDTVKSMIEQININKESLSDEQLEMLAPVLQQVLGLAGE